MTKSPLLGLLLAWLLPLCLQAANAPDWLKPVLEKEALSWSKRPTVFLLNQVELHYASSDKCTEHRLGAYQFNERLRGQSPTPLPLSYRGDTDRILKLLVWRVSPDGTVKSIPRSELTENSSTSRTMRYSGQQLLYPLEDLPVGTVIAWDFELEHSTGPLASFNWTPHRGLPVYKASLKVTAPPDLELLWKRFGPDSAPREILDKDGLSWSLQKVKNGSGERPDGFVPDQSSLALRCLPKNGKHADSDDWDGLARADYELFEGRTNPTPELQALADKLIAGKEGRWNRIRALTEFVQREITYLSEARETDYLAGFRPQVAADCLKNRYGDCKDKAALLKALLQCIGEEAHIVLLYTRDPLHVRPDWVANTFNHAINALPAGPDAPDIYPITVHPKLGRLVIVDTTASTGQLGVLPVSDQLGHALLCHPTQGGLFRLPGDSESCARKFTTRIRFEEEGKACIERVETSEGQSATLEHRWSDKVAADHVRRTLEGRYTSTGNSVSGLTYTKLWEPERLRHVLTVNFNSEQLLRKAAKDLYLINPLFARTATALSPWTSETPGVSMQPYLCLDEEILIELPPGTTLAEAPAPERVHSEKAHYVATLELEDRTLRLHTRYTQQAGLYSKTEYNSTRELRQRWLSAQKRPVVLSRVQKGK